eukprot:gene7625-13438_t
MGQAMSCFFIRKTSSFDPCWDETYMNSKAIKEMNDTPSFDDVHESFKFVRYEDGLILQENKPEVDEQAGASPGESDRQMKNASLCVIGKAITLFPYDENQSSIPSRKFQSSKPPL